MSFRELCAKHTKGSFGIYSLIQTEFGNWSFVSSGFTNRDHVVPFIAMILELDVWFASQTTYVRPPRFNSRVKALEKIVENLSAKQARNPNSKYLNTALPRAKLAFRRAKKEEANLRPVDII